MPAGKIDMHVYDLLHVLACACTHTHSYLLKNIIVIGDGAGFLPPSSVLHAAGFLPPSLVLHVGLFILYLI